MDRKFVNSLIQNPVQLTAGIAINLGGLVALIAHR